MISRVGLAISRVFERTVPDPFVIAILLTMLTAVLALAFGSFPAGANSLGHRLQVILDAWRFDPSRRPGSLVGIWKLLEFSMQMCLILVTGHALAVTAPVRAAIHSIARLPRNSASGAALVSLIACATALLNWGLGLIVGALLAREVGRSLHRRRIRAHYPLIAAAGYTGLMVWHGGLSGSAPLSMTTAAGAASVLPPQYAAQLGDGGVPLHLTLLSPMNLFISLGLLALAPAMFLLLAPRSERDVRTIEECGPQMEDELLAVEQPPRTIPDRLDRSRVLALLLAVPLVIGLFRFVQISGLGRLGLNEINATMLALGLILHGSPRAYMAAAEQGVRGCAGIIIQFPLYAGIMAMVQDAGLVKTIAEVFTRIGDERSVPVLSFLSACIVNLFVPSGGGQWAVQGPVALEAGLQAGAAPAKMIMSVAYGDQLTNMLQPFWALPLLAITGVKAREIVGYTAVVMFAGGAWIIAGLFLF